MKIQENKQLGFVVHNNKLVKNNIYNIHYDKYLSIISNDKDLLKKFNSEVFEFIYNPSSEAELVNLRKENQRADEIDNLLFPKNHYYIFSENAISASKTIKVDLSKFEPGIIKSLPENKMCTFLCGNKLAFKYWYKQGTLLCMIMELSDTPKGLMFNYLNFRLRITDNKYEFPSDNLYTANWKETYFVQFLQMLFFVEFSKAEYCLLHPNQSIGTKKEGKVFNETNKNIIVVNSSWNKIFIREDGFTVSPHLRWQPFGKERKQVKLIYIAEFEKDGYERRGLGTIKS